MRSSPTTSRCPLKVQRGFAIFINGEVDMNHWKLSASICSALLALVALQACATDAEPTDAEPTDVDSAPAQEAELTQQMDGCGAWLYRDTAAVSCVQQGDLDFGPGGTVGTCIDEEHISCKYATTCIWKALEVTTTCVEGSGACGLIPGNYPPNAPPAKVIPLAYRSRLCVRGAFTQNDYNNYCDSSTNSSVAYAEARQFCEAQTSSASGIVSCCLDCISTPPTPPTPARISNALTDTTPPPTPVCTGIEDPARI